MKAWPTKFLGDICQVIGGGTPSKQKLEYYSGSIPWATVRDMRREVIAETEFKITNQAVANSATNIIPGGNVVIATRVGLGKVCLLGQDTAINQDLRGIVPNDARVLSVRFLFWWLRSIADTIVAEGRGATVQGVNLGFIKSRHVPLPSVAVQRRIVGILDEAFDGIAKAAANAERNQQNSRVLFENELRSTFKRQGSSWMERRVGEVCALRSGNTLPPEIERSVGEIPYLKVADMNIGENVNGIVHSSRYVNRRDVRASALFPVGTTIFPKRGGAILTNKKRLTKRVICADLNIMGVVPLDGLLPAFLFAYFLQVDLREIDNGSSIPQINNYSIEPLLIAFPESADEQTVVAQRLEALSAECRRLTSLYQRKLTALDKLKASLLHHAFSGQL